MTRNMQGRLAMTKLKLPVLACTICGWAWTPRTNPKVCPKCKNKNWDTGRVRKIYRKRAERRPEGGL